MGNVSRGQRNCNWIEEHCRIPEGQFVGRPVKLRAWQKKDICKIYDNPAITRTHIQSMGRKNAKTTMSAFLVLLHLVGPESKLNSQLVSTATSKEQAALLYALAAKVIRMSPTLEPVIALRESAKQLYCPDRGTVYRALSSEASTNFGSSPVFAVHDEIGQVKGPRSELYEAVETGMSAHEHPLSIIISTQAPTDADLFSVLIDDALGGHDPKITISLYTAPKEDNPFTVKSIKKANPAYGDFLNAEEVRKTMRNAKRMPSNEPSFRNLILNQRVDADAVFVSHTVWLANGAEPDDDWGKARVYGGLDLSATTDLTALALIANIRSKWHVKSQFWLPNAGLRDKAKQDRVAYDLWHEQGFLNTTPGATIEYAYIAYELRKIFDRYNIGSIAFDRWNWKFLRPWLVDAGFRDWELEKFIPFGQGYMSMSPALRQFESVLISRQMKHGNHPVLSMCAANAVVQSDPAGNRKLAKDKSSGRIDGMVALAMAMGVTEDDKQEFVTGRLRTV